MGQRARIKAARRMAAILVAQQETPAAKFEAATALVKTGIIKTKAAGKLLDTSKREA
jgi:hypothetical protein